MGIENSIADSKQEHAEQIRATWERAQAVVKVFIEGPHTLTDDELEQIKTDERDIEALLSSMGHSGVRACLDEANYRERKAELDSLSTEEVQAIYEREFAEYTRVRQAYDSRYMPAPYDVDGGRHDSDLRVTRDLLADRAEADAAAA